MVLHWVCFGSNEQAMVLLGFAWRPTKNMCLLHRFCLRGQRLNCGFTFVLVRVNEKHRFCILFAQGPTKNIGFTLVFSFLNEKAMFFTMVLLRVKRESIGFTMVLLWAKRTSNCFTMVLFWL